MVAELMQIQYNILFGIILVSICSGFYLILVSICSGFYLFWFLFVLVSIYSGFYLFCDDVLCIALNTENELIDIVYYIFIKKIYNFDEYK
jgi:hypothetical protein